MMRVRAAAIAVTVSAALAAGATAAGAAKGPPPPPTAPGGQTVTQVAAGLQTPTSFAVGAGKVFEGDGGAETSKVPHGGVYLLTGGKGVKLAGSPNFVSGLAWHQGALYVAGGTLTKNGPAWQLQRWSGFNGTTFAKRTVIYTGPKKFQGFDGIAFGPDGRLYAGVAASGTNNNDHGPASTSPYLYDILSMKANGKGLKVFATGIRQPWQMAFAPGSKYPYVSNLGQDSGANEKKVPDFVLHVHPGDNYGFPKCNWIKGSPCQGYTKPFQFFSPHTDIMGMAIIGKKLYMTSFLGSTGKAGEVFSMPLTGGKLTPVVTGFVAPTVGLGTDGTSLYIGEVTGQVFKVTP
jgi:glucose/arabinose dehydrogenase